jgi:hypothetical protein
MTSSSCLLSVCMSCPLLTTSPTSAQPNRNDHKVIAPSLQSRNQVHSPRPPNTPPYPIPTTPLIHHQNVPRCATPSLIPSLASRIDKIARSPFPIAYCKVPALSQPLLLLLQIFMFCLTLFHSFPCFCFLTHLFRPYSGLAIRPFLSSLCLYIFTTASVHSLHSDLATFC